MGINCEEGINSWRVLRGVMRRVMKKFDLIVLVL
jgi:hypothetical protein